MNLTEMENAENLIRLARQNLILARSARLPLEAVYMSILEAQLAVSVAQLEQTRKNEAKEKDRAVIRQQLSGAIEAYRMMIEAVTERNDPLDIQAAATVLATMIAPLLSFVASSVDAL